MTDKRIGSPKPLTAPTPARPTQPVTPADSTAAPAAAARISADSLAVSDKNRDTAEAMAVLKAAGAIGRMPKAVDAQKAWLMEGFTHQLKGKSAANVLRNAMFDKRVSFETYSNATAPLDALDKKLKASPQYESVKKEFFNGLSGPAQALLSSLASFPAPPADKAGKAAWLAEGKQKAAQARAAEKLLKDIWFEHRALDFDAMSEGGRKLWDFEARLSQVDRELNPRPAKPKGSAPKGKRSDGQLDAFRPLMGNTQATSDMMQKSKAGEALGSVVLPFAMMIDMIDLITRPAQMAEQAKNKKQP